MAGMKGQSGGRNRLPTDAKRRRGTLRGSRQRAHEPQPDIGLPAAPSWLTKRARVHYELIGQQLVGLRVMTEADGHRLALLAHAIDEHQEADELVRAEGLVLTRETESGSVRYRHPAAIVRDGAARRIVDGLRAFGMDPQSRAGVSAIPLQDDATERFFS